MSRIVLVAPSPEFASRLTDAFGPIIDEAVAHWWYPDLFTDPSIAAAKIAAEDPALVLFQTVEGADVFHERFAVEMAIQIIGELTSTHPEASSVLLTEPRTELFALAMRAGARDVIDPEASAEEIKARVSGLLGIADRLRSTAALVDTRPQGSVVTMLEPKGGSGKTSIVSNLAVIMSQRFPGEVIIIDLDLQFGDLTDALLLEPRYTLADVAKLPGQMDATTLKAFLTRRNDLFILCAPTTPAEADLITPGIVAQVVALLRQEFKWVLIDTAAGLIEPTLSVLDHSTDLVLVASLDVFSIRNLSKTIQIMDQLGLVIPSRHLVLNRADSKVGLDKSEAIFDLGMRRATEVPSSRHVPLSLNRGQPVVEMQPRSPVSRKIADLAEELISAREQRSEWSTS